MGSPGQSRPLSATPRRKREHPEKRLALLPIRRQEGMGEPSVPAVNPWPGG